MLLFCCSSLSLSLSERVKLGRENAPWSNHNFEKRTALFLIFPDRSCRSNPQVTAMSFEVFKQSRYRFNVGAQPFAANAMKGQFAPNLLIDGPLRELGDVSMPVLVEILSPQEEKIIFFQNSLKVGFGNLPLYSSGNRERSQRRMSKSFCDHLRRVANFGAA